MSKVREILADLTCTNYKDYSLAGRDATEKVWNKLKKQAETTIRAAIADELEEMKKANANVSKPYKTRTFCKKKS